MKSLQTRHIELALEYYWREHLPPPIKTQVVLFLLKSASMLLLLLGPWAVKKRLECIEEAEHACGDAEAEKVVWTGRRNK